MAKRELTNAEAFAKFDHDHDGRPGGAPKGGNRKEAKMAKAAAKKATARKSAIKRGDQTPEAKKTPAAQSDAAEMMFKDADEAALRGLPADMTRDQHETMVRKAALGY